MNEANNATVIVGPVSPPSAPVTKSTVTVRAANHPRSGGLEGPPAPRWQLRLWRIVATQARFALVVGAVVAVVAGVLGGLAAASGATRYSSTTLMMIDDPYQLATAGDAGQLLKLESLRVKYAGLIGTDVIAGPVAAELGLTPQQVIGAVTPEVSGVTLLMGVQATWRSPQMAQRLSSAVADEVTSYVRAQDVAFRIPAADRFTFDTVDPATPAVAEQPSRYKAATVGVGAAVIGFVLGFGVVQAVRNRRLSAA
ncbi:MAG: hypothetical protein M0Z82_16925 [Actinomycetota bacterium]|jgi:capsular polysaccharide biosynthesis protein|nr:hypothetical protein [Actinomycetota bacterium]